MIHFLDGPAKGVKLQLPSAPPMLRVIKSPSGHIDALNHPFDEPYRTDEVYVYRRVGEVRTALVVLKRSPHREIVVFTPNYRAVPDQPGDVVRTRRGWLEWRMGEEVDR